MGYDPNAAWKGPRGGWHGSRHVPPDPDPVEDDLRRERLRLMGVTPGDVRVPRVPRSRWDLWDVAFVLLLCAGATAVLLVLVARGA